MELIKYGHKEPVVQAPVYEEGDWWVYRAKEEGKRPWNARVTYKDGKFESDNPTLLRGEDMPGRRIIFGSALVYLNDPKNKGLEFPLVPGKKWSFRYRVPGNRAASPWAFAEVEVIGPVAQPVKTPAGNFNVIEIQRTDWVGYYTEITYFYSPESKSVVKITSVHESESGDFGFYGGGMYKTHAELELIAYGRKATASEQPVVKAPIIE